MSILSLFGLQSTSGSNNVVQPSYGDGVREALEAQVALLKGEKSW